MLTDRTGRWNGVCDSVRRWWPSPQTQGYMTLQEEGGGSGGNSCPGCGVPGRFGGKALKTVEGLQGKAGILIP